MFQDLTVVILLHNHAPWVARAVRSVVKLTDSPILVVDDFSRDDSISRAIEAGKDQVTILKTGENLGPANTAWTGFSSVKTPYILSMGGDDFLVPGRIEAGLSAFENQNADLVYGGVTLCDGPTGEPIKTLTIPNFLKAQGAICRQFERNWIGGIGYPMLRTKVVQKLGMRLNLPILEDYDLMLRAIANGCNVSLIENTDMAYCAYPGSLSRNLPLARENFRAVYDQFDAAVIAGLYKAAGYEKVFAHWANLSIAIRCGRQEQALKILEVITANHPADDNFVLEPGGPYPYSESWRRNFHRGTILLHLGRTNAATVELKAALSLRRSAETLNNLGVAIRRGGCDREQARPIFAEALELYPSYRDARDNLESGKGEEITNFPIRRHPSHDDY